MRIPAPPPRARLHVLLLAAGLSLALVSGYLLLCTMGFSLPCPVYALTGLYCPGCGVTRMLLALLRLDFAAAGAAAGGSGPPLFALRGGGACAVAQKVTLWPDRRPAPVWRGTESAGVRLPTPSAFPVTGRVADAFTQTLPCALSLSPPRWPDRVCAASYPGLSAGRL